MKTTHICPKCNSTFLLRSEGVFQGYGPGNNIKVGLLTQIRPTKYICSNCGFIEEWIDGPDDLEKLKKYLS